MESQRTLLPVAKPWMDEREANAAGRAILSGWVTQGPEVAAFEREFASYVGASFACAVSNCTTALHMALLTAGVKPGDEVITVSHSYIATANSIRYCGAVPVFVDIQPETFNIDPALIEAAIGERTKAILCVHQLGMPCDLEAIIEIARRHSIPVIEDAACAIGSEVLRNGVWEPIGRPHGDIVCFSFHPRKVMTTGDGGMLTTANAEWDRHFRLLRQHGMSVPDTVRHNAREVIFESYPIVGYNYRMTDIQAAVGREQLKRLPEIIARRRALADRYRELLGEIPEIDLPVEPAFARGNWQSYCIRLRQPLDQYRVMQSMLDDGIATRRGVMCAHREPAYRDEPWRCADPEHDHADGVCSNLRNSVDAQEHAIVLPLFHQMTDDDQLAVAHALRKAIVAEQTLQQVPA